MKKFDAILGADFHIREVIPACRTDDYLAAQWNKLAFIKDLCCEHECILLIAGDLFDHWKPSPFLLARCFELLPKKTIMIPGQHDLQGHNLENSSKTGYNALEKAGAIKALSRERKAVLGPFYGVYGRAYGEDLTDIQVLRNKSDKNPKILLLHTLVCQTKQLWPGAEATRAEKLLQQTNADLIVTGDNHQQFVVQKKGKLLVNPGSMMRMASDQADFEPAVFGWTAKTNEVERIPLPIEKDVVQKIERVNREERDQRMEAYIEKMKSQFEIGLSFTKNMEQFLQKEKTNDDVKKLIWEAVDEKN